MDSSVNILNALAAFGRKTCAFGERERRFVTSGLLFYLFQKPLFDVRDLFDLKNVAAVFLYSIGKEGEIHEFLQESYAEYIALYNADLLVRLRELAKKSDYKYAEAPEEIAYLIEADKVLKDIETAEIEAELLTIKIKLAATIRAEERRTEIAEEEMTFDEFEELLDEVTKGA